VAAARSWTDRSTKPALPGTLPLGGCNLIGRRVRCRRRGVCHCASAQPCLDCSPTQAGQTLLGPAGACAWSAAGLGWHRPGQPRSAAGRGVQGPVSWRVARPSIRAREVVWPVTELLARVGGSSVSLNCSCADQGGRHGDMVVGADRRGRCCVGVWCDAASGPLTGATPAARSRLALLLDQADGLAVGPVGLGPVGAADHPALPGLAGSCAQPGWGHARAATASSSLLEGPRRWPSKPSCAQGRSGLAWTTMARVTRGT
jgi:hypothetical protein